MACKLIPLLKKCTFSLIFLLAFVTASFAQNAIVTENLLPGTPRNVWDEGDLGRIKGFATEFSVNKGSRVNFKIDIDANTDVPYSVEIFRIGYYQGNGARFITQLFNNGNPLMGQRQPAYDYEQSTGKVDCSNWAVSCFWDVPSTAVSGVYVARLDCGPVASTALIIFVVRDDAANSQVLFKTSDATWQAYNAYGGNNFYSALIPVPGYSHATKLSYQRPLTLRGDKSNFFSDEFPMLMWLERNGYDVTYATDMDMARDASVFTPAKHKVLLSVGHDEYWSQEQRTKFETARNNGVNIAWFSGNSVYWKTRWENNYQTLVCYKEGTQGIYSCGTKCDPLPNVWTGLWRDGCAPVYGTNDGCYPEGSLVAQMGWNESTSSIEVPDTYKNYRIWKNTSVASLSPGQKVTLPFGTLGAEWDQEDLVETYPAHRNALSFTAFNGLTHKMAMYKNAGQGFVFSAGSMQWSWGLDTNHDNFPVNPVSLDMQQATYNILFDMGAIAGSKQSDIITATASTDNLAPTSIITSPLHNASVPGSPIVISGTSTDNGGGFLAGVEISLDNGVTWTRTTGTSNWSYSFIPENSTSIIIKVRGWDDVFNVETNAAPGTANCITINPAGPFTNSLFENDLPSTLPSFQDIGFPMELGMKFKTTVAGSITGFRYYKHPNGSGAIVGHLWSATGTLLATQPFINETASGWQEVNLNSPVAINANTTYVISYFSPAGKYVEEDQFFATAYVNGVLRGLAEGEDGKNGVNNFNGFAFPTGGPGFDNYYADVLFQPTTDNLAPATIITAPVHNATVAGTSITISGTSSDNGGGNVVLVEVSTDNGVTWNAATGLSNWSYTFSPTDNAPLTIKARGRDNVFNIEVPGVPGSANCIVIIPAGPFTNSLFENDLPVTLPSFQNIGFPMELGMKFKATVYGTITGFRYYKHPNSTGIITGHLWSASGTLLATQEFTNETASGWQSVALAAPVTISPNTTYVVSYFSPSGKYAETIPFFATTYVNGVLRGLADGEEGKNGINNFNGFAFPAGGPGLSNYYADVLFQPTTDNLAPASVISSPLHNASVPGSPITISGTSSDNGGGTLVSVEVSTDNGVTWNTATGLSNWTYTFSPADYGTIIIKVRARDNVSNIEVPGAPGSANCIAINPAGPFMNSLFENDLPATLPPFQFIGFPMELGMKFKTTVPGLITGFRYYKHPNSTGLITGHLWAGTGTLLAAQDFTNETASGWQSVNLTSPVAIVANTTYVISYYSPLGKYVEQIPFFEQPYINGLIRGLADGEAGKNGVNNFNGLAFPTGGPGLSNYYADVLFQSADATAPLVVSISPLNNALSVALNVAPSATFNEPLSPGTINASTVMVTGPGNTIINGSVSLNGATVTFTPLAALNPGTEYTVTLKGGNSEPVVKDLSGNKLATDYTWSFTTVLTPEPPVVIIQPLSINTCSGSNISFVSSASGSPSPSVQWQISTDGGVNWNIISGAINPTYTFSAANGNNNNQYRAVWANSLSTVNSDAALLTILPDANAGKVTGNSPLCIGAATVYSANGNPGGTWSSSNPLVATVNAAGLVTATGAGNANIIYTINTGCNSPVSSFATLTVNPNANAGIISGNAAICVGSTGNFSSDGNPGGAWSSSNPLVATVNISSGLVTTLLPGTINIIYTVNSGCNGPVSSFKTLTVTALANAGTVNGTSPLCIGATTTYSSNGNAGGTWGSSNTAVATVNADGIVTATGVGTTNISYTINAGCNSPVTSFKTLVINPNANAGTVNGTSPLCIGATAAYSANGNTGGTWSSTNTGVATVNANGLVTATGAGTTNITYTVNGCNGPVSSFKTLTVIQGSNAGLLNGSSPLCIGATATYTSNGNSGGIWSSTNTSVATVNPATGLVTAISAGTTDIKYTVSGCNGVVGFSIKTLLVKPNANAGVISGNSPLCSASTATYTSNGDAGGTWSSGNPWVALINPTTGYLFGTFPGTTNITYTVNGCNGPVSSYKALTVNFLGNPGTITGLSPLCIGASADYTTNGYTGGTWSSTNTAVATVNPTTGLVTAISAGTADIKYTVNGCLIPTSVLKSVTVNPNVNAGTVNGNSSLCIGASTTYASNGNSGGTWSSTNTTVATVNASGLVTATGAGSASIKYTINTGCNSPVSSFKTLSVSATGNAGTVNGITPLCINASATYTNNGTAGGTWSSSNTAVATVNAAGLVTATGAGTANITYSVNTGCNNVSSFKTLTVNSNANAGTLSGTSSLCIGATTTYTSNGNAGGTWSSTNTSVATVNAAGLVTATGAGTANIKYSVNAGCNSPVSSLKAITVNANANAGTVSGNSTLCIGATATYTTNGNTGGSWSSTNASVATVNSATGAVTATGAGTTSIKYTISTGCNSPVSSSKTLTVNPNANAGTVTGTSPLCIGAAANYTSNGNTGGSWSSTNTSVATVNPATGAVTATGAGTTSIKYTISTGCNSPVSSSKTLTVNPNANAGTVTGTSPLCIGATATYTADGNAGGSWMSSNTSVATINSATGAVTAVGTGTTSLKYIISTGCNSTVSSSKTLIVNPSINAGTISGNSYVWLGSNVGYTSNGDLGGTWSSSNTWVATINPSTGLFYAAHTGTATIKYLVTGCSGTAASYKTITVYYSGSSRTVSSSPEVKPALLHDKESNDIKPFMVEASPNPFLNKLQVKIEATQAENAIISLTDMSGRKIMQRQCQLTKGSNTIWLSNFNNAMSGVYLLRITTDSRQEAIKVVKQ